MTDNYSINWDNTITTAGNWTTNAFSGTPFKQTTKKPVSHNINKGDIVQVIYEDSEDYKRYAEVRRVIDNGRTANIKYLDDSKDKRDTASWIIVHDGKMTLRLVSGSSGGSIAAEA